MELSSSSSSNDQLLLESNYFQRSHRSNRQFVSHPINKNRRIYGEFHHLYADLRKDPSRFFEYMRMDITTFDYLSETLQPHLIKSWRNCHGMPIEVEEQMMVTLRYLSTGTSFRGLAFSFRMGKTTVGEIVKRTINKIWIVLCPLHMKSSTKEDYKKISDDYYRIWNFPHCIGSVDGKRVRIKCPNHTGSSFYNYKSFFSIVLQGTVNASYKFINIDVGGYGRQSDGGTFRSSALYKHMINKTLPIPENSKLPGSDLVVPYVFIGDEAYPLLENILKPYSKQELDSDKEYFNKRLSRARRSVELAFGIINSKWRILSKPIETNPKTADDLCVTQYNHR